jgi:uncharacterized 2Fe-2S/4Fe-4S cluster protein (DUF4445 family)
MLDWKVLDRRGMLNKNDPRVRVNDRITELVLVPAQETGNGQEIVITRRDVNEIQLAKGAIRAGIEILLEESGLSAEAVDDWIIAGAFGTFLDLGSAIRAGMFPAMPLERFHQVGNAAGVGAKQMLLSCRKRDEAREIVAPVRYVELTVHPHFTQVFTDSMYF